jgi:molybdopterin-dependent oxidoreductase alpha subunit
MRAPRPNQDIDETKLTVSEPAHEAAGAKAVAIALKHAVDHMGTRRTALTLPKLNQLDGFDCQGCAWPDPEHRHAAEFCENGAKAVAEEATKLSIGPEFFAKHSIEFLAGKTDYWLGQQGRLTAPVVRRPGATHYEPITWAAAFALVAEHLQALESPDEALFYTSGKTSNEAAYLWQLLARAYGTNNLPDCSNMCHESSGSALVDTIGVGKGSVSLEDFDHADLIVVLGQNPGTNHPRMLSALERAKKRGAKIIAVNPLREAGLVRFKNPQTPKGVALGTALADLYLRVKVNGDLALLQALGSLLVDDADHEFIAQHTTGFAAYHQHVNAVDWDLVHEATGLEREVIDDAAVMLRESKATIFCWAMGITQHRNAVATIKEIVNLALLQGNIGKPGAGLCPVRGHSNVQGDRTMGIWEKMPDSFLDALRDEFGFEPPRDHGLDTVDGIKALRDGRARVFLGMGGNFTAAAPDTEVTEAAMRAARLTAHVSTKLNRSHVVPGETALILPTLGRSERDKTGGRDQKVTVEDSMSAVHASRGPLKPPSEHLRSEVDIVCRLGEALGLTAIPWREFRTDYATIRQSIGRVVPGADDFDARATSKHGFVLPHPPRDSRTFPTSGGKAVFTASPIDLLQVPEGRLILQTIRSHDQFNTTIYGLDDRYRGIHNGRRVVFVNPEDIDDLSLRDGQVVDLVSEWHDRDRRAAAFRIVAYDQPRGCAAAYYPETNPLVPLDSTALESNCPTSKSIIIRLEA